MRLLTNLRFCVDILRLRSGWRQSLTPGLAQLKQVGAVGRHIGVIGMPVIPETGFSQLEGIQYVEALPRSQPPSDQAGRIWNCDPSSGSLRRPCCIELPRAQPHRPQLTQARQNMQTRYSRQTVTGGLGSSLRSLSPRISELRCVGPGPRTPDNANSATQ